jgi:nucleotide-binding universal stress UspA family protein/predicted transcriptional regulator
MVPEVYDELLATERETAETYLEQVRQRLAERGLEVETFVREGAPAEGILDLADDLGAATIVMASHGRGGLGRFLLGSVAERVLQEATIPILLVPAGIEQPTPTTFSRLLIPLDGSGLAERAIEAARGLVAKEARLVLLQVVAPMERRVFSDEGAVTVADEKATKHAADRAEQYLERLRESRDLAEISTSAVRIGQPGPSIVAAAREHAVDVIVMASHGRTGAARWWLGSVADEVVRQAGRPVYLVSARALAARVAGEFTVRDVMTRDVALVKDDEPVISALRKLLRRRVSGLPVVNADWRVVGIISEADLLRWQERFANEATKHPELSPAEYARRLEADGVRGLMSHPPVTIEESAPLSAARRLLADHEIRRLPVTRDGRLIGVVARADLLKAMAEQYLATVEQPREAAVLVPAD